MLKDLREFKVPALRQAGFELATEVTTVLMARSGLTEQLRRAASEDQGMGPLKRVDKK